MHVGGRELVREGEETQSSYRGCMLHNWTKRNKPSVVWGPGMYARCHDKHNYPEWNAHCGPVFLWGSGTSVSLCMCHVCVCVRVCGWVN